MRADLSRCAALAAVLCCCMSTAVLGAAKDTTGTSSATITASPNPVPPGAGAGTTTLTWNAGAEELAEVWVQQATEAENLFARGKTGTKEAAWIGNATYVFRLYRGTEHKTVLASVTVTRAAAGAGSPGGVTATGQAPGTPGSGSASPPANAGALALGYFLLGAGTTGLVWFVRWRSSRDREKTAPPHER